MKLAVYFPALLLTLSSYFQQKPILPNVFPEPNANNVCTDAVVRIRFETQPRLGKEGKITVTDLDGAHVAYSADCAIKTIQRTLGGFPNFNSYPYTVNDKEVEIPLLNLKQGRTYRIDIDWSLFPGLKQTLHQNNPTLSWTFSTRTQIPKISTQKLIVAADGTGDFCTVQGALDFIPEGNQLPRIIFIKKGIYPEIVAFDNKNNIKILGESRDQTILAYTTNEKFNGSGGNPYDPKNQSQNSGNTSAHIYHRSVFLAHHTEGLTLQNFTIHNTTPQGGSQAEAIILNGLSRARAILKDLDLYSFQDTLQLNGQTYVTGCHIEGDVDFMWGKGPCYFKNCACVALRSNAYYTQVRNPKTNHGFVFVACRFIGADQVRGNYLSRIEINRFPYSEVVVLNCELSNAVASQGWLLQTKGDSNQLHFWEYNSFKNPHGLALDLSERMSSSKQLIRPKDSALIDSYLDPTFVLGNAWTPKL
jgi:pectin methylesterase-like acyl-CoA thioesterase